MHQPQHPVAGIDVGDDDPDAENIHDFRQGDVFAPHLGVDAVEPLFPRDEARFDIAFGDALVQIGDDLSQKLPLAAPGAAQGAIQNPIPKRCESPEAQVFQLHLQTVHAQAVGDRGIDLQRLLGDSASLWRGQVLDGAHVVGSVGQLDQDDPQILHHGQEHLAEGFGLGLDRAVEAQLVQLADAVHQQRDIVTEPPVDVVQGTGRILEHVVQQRGLDGAGVQVQVRENAGDGDGVTYVVVAAEPLLSVVSRGGGFIGVKDAGQFGFGKIALQLPHELAEAVRPPQ